MILAEEKPELGSEETGGLERGFVKEIAFDVGDAIGERFVLFSEIPILLFEGVDFILLAQASTAQHKEAGHGGELNEAVFVLHGACV